MRRKADCRLLLDLTNVVDFALTPFERDAKSLNKEPATMFSELISTQSRDPRLPNMARHLQTTFMISSGDQDTLITINQGRVEQIRSGPFIMPSYSFRLAAPGAEWEEYLKPIPKPGSHDIIALLRRGVLRFEGDLHPLMSHLLFFKFLLATLRGPGDEQ